MEYHTFFIVIVFLIIITFSISFKWDKSRRFREILGLFTVLGLLFLLIVLFIISGGSKFYWWSLNTSKWDHFGSILSAVLLATTLFFQIRAFRRQQVEAKFFELVKYYRDNLSEMNFRNPFYYKKGGRKVDEEFISGRRVIKTIFDQYKVGQKIANNFIKGKIDIVQYNELFENLKKKYKEQNWGDIGDQANWYNNYLVNEIAYLITYWGVPLDSEEDLKSYLKNIPLKGGQTSLINFLEKVITVYEFKKDERKTYSGNLKFISKDIFQDTSELNKYRGKTKFFGGHQYHLGHYFRHLFQSVTYIDKQPWWLFSKSEKYEYIKTLRAQMSNYEQALFFINSLTQLGRKWEYENNSKIGLISRYNLIKNLPENFVPAMKPQYYYPSVDYEWKEKTQIKTNSKLKK